MKEKDKRAREVTRSSSPFDNLRQLSVLAAALSRLSPVDDELFPESDEEHVERLWREAGELDPGYKNRPIDI